MECTFCNQPCARDHSVCYNHFPVTVYFYPYAGSTLKFQWTNVSGNVNTVWMWPMRSEMEILEDYSLVLALPYCPANITPENIRNKVKLLLAFS